MEKLLTHDLMLWITSSFPFLSFTNQSCPLVNNEGGLAFGKIPQVPTAFRL